MDIPEITKCSSLDLFRVSWLTRIFLTWVSYCSFKNFGRIIGVPGNQSYESPHHVETLKDCTVSQYCAGVLIDSNENVLKTFSYIDLDTINRSQNQSNGILLINLVTEPHLLGQSQLDFMKFEQCCVQEKNTILKAPEHLTKINDTLERIDCNSITMTEFEKEYVLKRKAVMLVNCTKDWKAQKTWTIRGLLSRYPKEEKKYWTTGFKDMIENFNEAEEKLKWFDEEEFGRMEEDNHEESIDKSQMLGQDVIEIIKNKNISFRVFEKVGLPYSLRNMPEAKTDLYRDWSTPKPIPKDLYKHAIRLHTDYSWVIMGCAGSGTNLHQDPDLTDAWNSLLYGHKESKNILLKHFDFFDLLCFDSI
ncbi:uncharacterized protein [Lepeophtheirus salmonis]|uniref:uncharacterized protein n=1 Tax=Lepeophtheirus salmonis TaxID=72036 RepID=UPI003AF375B2